MKLQTAPTPTPTILDRIIQQEELREIVSVLTPRQATIAGLRLVGLSSKQIAQLLGVSVTTISMHMHHARRRIARFRPDLAPFLHGRRHNSGPWSTQHRTLDWSWFADEDDDNDD